MTSGNAPDGGPARRGPERVDHELELAALRADLDALAGEFATLAGAIADGPGGPAWPDWFTLDQRRAEKAWTGLWAWIRDYLCPTYLLTRAELPDCWTRHPGMRDEMSWLWGTHRAAYGSAGGPTVVSSWHLTWRDGALRGVAQVAHRAGCSPGKCRGQRITDTLPAEGELTSADLWIQDGIDADLQRRRAEPDQ